MLLSFRNHSKQLLLICHIGITMCSSILHWHLNIYRKQIKNKFLLPCKVSYMLTNVYQYVHAVCMCVSYILNLALGLWNSNFWPKLKPKKNILIKFQPCFSSQSVCVYLGMCVYVYWCTSGVWVCSSLSVECMYVCLSMGTHRYQFTCRLFSLWVIFMSVYWGWMKCAECRVAAPTKNEASQVKQSRAHCCFITTHIVAMSNLEATANPRSSVTY